MRSLINCLAFLAVAATPCEFTVPRATAQDVDVGALYDKVVRSCVYIITELPAQKAYAQGSGSLIDAEQKLVLTNYHVVDEEPFVYVQFPIFVKNEIMTEKEKYKDRWKQGQLTKCKVLFRDKNRDLAIVKVDKIPPGMKAIPLAKDSPRPGTRVWQIGNAGAITQVFRISKGDVSAVGPFNEVIGGDEDALNLKCKVVTATVPTNAGDSGGPLFDKRGYQVAVTEGGMPSARLVNFFVDVTEVRSLLAEKKIKIKELSDEPDPKVDPKDPPMGDPKKDPPKGNGKTDPAAPSEADEKTAADLLRRAGLFKGDETTYIERLTEIIKKWPKTVAGKEAKKRLDGLKK